MTTIAPSPFDKYWEIKEIETELESLSFRKIKIKFRANEEHDFEILSISEEYTRWTGDPGVEPNQYFWVTYTSQEIGWIYPPSVYRNIYAEVQEHLWEDPIVPPDTASEYEREMGTE